MSQVSDDQKIRALLAQLEERESENARYKATLKELRKPISHHLRAMGMYFEMDQKKVTYYINQLEITGKI
jgi:hypothetical protein